MPATTGEANEVPDPFEPNSPFVEYQSDSPGAATVDRRPLLVQYGLAPLEFVAVTATTLPNAAG